MSLTVDPLSSICEWSPADCKANIFSAHYSFSNDGLQVTEAILHAYRPTRNIEASGAQRTYFNAKIK